MEDEPEQWQEQQRLYNFLKHYDLLKYHKKFLEKGVRRLSHLKDVAADDASLDEIGLSRPERLRLRKKVKENVEWMGKFKKRIAGKLNRFDDPAPQVAHTLMEMENQKRTAAIITKDQISLGQRIGEGAHGSVYEGTWSNIHGSVAVAVKTLYGKQEAQGQFIKEANSMCSLNHKHIIQLYGIVLAHPLMLVEELAPLGSLYKYLKERGGTLNVEHFQTYASQIAEAMRYLEGRRIVHRDLATRNVLLTNQNHVKLSDFGMARVLDDNSEVYNLSNLGARIPIAWTAPEALTRAKFSTSSDVWSYGIVLWEIYSLGKIPWDGLSPIEIRDHLLRGERLSRPSRCPLDVYEVMLECWEPAPQDRPTFAILVQKVDMIVCPKVRAIKPHFIDDEDSLSFKSGEHIFLIDKPKPGWMYGMMEDGKVGQFQADHVTTYINPVGDLKEKITHKKAKPSDFVITGPTDVDHTVHWGSDGKKWVSQNSSEKESSVLDHTARRTNGVESSSSSSGSSSGPASPPFKVIRSPSPGSSRPSDTLLDKQCQSGNSVATVQSQPYIYPIAKEIKTGEHTLHHVPDEDVADRKEEEGQSSAAAREETADLIDLNSDLPPSPDRSYKRFQSEDDQYISMSRSRTLNAELLKTLTEGRKGDDEFPPNSNDTDPSGGYLTMRSYPVHLQQQLTKSGLEGDYLEIGAQHDEVPSYGTVEQQMHGKPHHLTNTADSAAEMSEPLIPASSSAVPSQFSFASATLDSRGGRNMALTSSSTEDAIVPSSIRFIYQRPSATPASNMTVETSTASVRFQNDADPRVSPVPSTWRNTQHHGISTLPVIRGKLESESDTGPPVVPPRSHAVGHKQQQHKQVAADSDIETNRCNKPPMPPPRIKTNSEIKSAQTLPPKPTPLTRGGVSHKGVAAALTETEIKMQSLILSDPEFQSCTPAVCMHALKKHNYELKAAKEEIRVHMLMEMQIAYIDDEDCRRALSHCQQKIDRAALWLLEQSDDIERRTH